MWAKIVNQSWSWLPSWQAPSRLLTLRGMRNIFRVQIFKLVSARAQMSFSMVYLSCISQPSNLSCISNLSNFATTPGVKYRLALPRKHFEIADAHISDRKNIFRAQLAKFAVWGTIICQPIWPSIMLWFISGCHLCLWGCSKKNPPTRGN